jgi:hypothetical protein
MLLPYYFAMHNVGTEARITGHMIQSYISGAVDWSLGPRNRSAYLYFTKMVMPFIRTVRQFPVRSSPWIQMLNIKVRDKNRAL